MVGLFSSSFTNDSSSAVGMLVRLAPPCPIERTGVAGAAFILSAIAQPGLIYTRRSRMLGQEFQQCAVEELRLFHIQHVAGSGDLYEPGAGDPLREQARLAVVIRDVELPGDHERRGRDIREMVGGETLGLEPRVRLSKCLPRVVADHGLE